jgi:hypothetical protein
MVANRTSIAVVGFAFLALIGCTQSDPVSPVSRTNIGANDLGSFDEPESPAATPQTVTIVQHSELDGPSNFVATGAISDSGPITLDSVNATALPSPVVGTAHYIRTYRGELGTFTLKMQTLITPTDVPWLWAEKGEWLLASGTGAYEGLRGEGHEEGIRDFAANALDVVFTGKVR